MRLLAFLILSLSFASSIGNAQTRYFGLQQDKAIIIVKLDLDGTLATDPSLNVENGTNDVELAPNEVLPPLNTIVMMNRYQFRLASIENIAKSQPLLAINWYDPVAQKLKVRLTLTKSPSMAEFYYVQSAAGNIYMVGSMIGDNAVIFAQNFNTLWFSCTNKNTAMFPIEIGKYNYIGSFDPRPGLQDVWKRVEEGKSFSRIEGVGHPPILLGEELRGFRPAVQDSDEIEEIQVLIAENGGNQSNLVIPEIEIIDLPYNPNVWNPFQPTNCVRPRR